jgi:glycosyltransferase involved in cell wall biosynthesis
MARRILYIHNGCDLYGASRSLLRLVTRLDRAKFVPFVILPLEGPLAGALRKEGVHVTVMRSLSVISRSVFHSWRIIPFLLTIPVSVAVLAIFMKKTDIRLVHTNVGSVVSAGLAAKLAGVRHVWHLRDSFHDFGRLWKLYSRYVLWSSDKVICVSKAISAQFRDTRGKVTVVYNGIPLEESEEVSDEEVAAFKARFGLNGKRAVGVVGRIKFQRKGQDVFVRAAALLKRKLAETRYVIVGSPFPGNEVHLERLQKLIAELGISREVILTGDVENIYPVYKALDVLVLPSCTPEPFAGVVLEAMAAGTPIIGTALGGTIEQIEAERSGLLVEPNNPEILAESILRVLTDDALSDSLRREARKRVEEIFRFEKMYERLEEIYTELLR